MAYSNNLTVLVADNDEEARQHMASLLKNHGYTVIQAIDGGSAIRVVDENSVDAAIIDHTMKPYSGLDFAKHVMARGHDIGLIMVTDDPTTDLLLEAGKLEIKQIMRKPVDPDRLAETVRRVLRSSGKAIDSQIGGAEKTYTPEELMQRAIALAQQNALSRMGGPYGAVVSNADGQVIGEGVNSVIARADPTAHAEIMAIRRATERTNNMRLEGCAVYCSSEPTMLGQALITATGLTKVYYALSHEDVGNLRKIDLGILGEISKPFSKRQVSYQQMQHDHALTMFRALNDAGRKRAGG